MEKFSVAMSVYRNDNPVHFDRALNSITDNQTIVPDEVVLVVDGPISDELNDVIIKYEQKGIFNVVRLSENGGLGNALKIATNNCKYELIARMDSDDIAVNNRFEMQLMFFEKNPNVDIVGGNINEFIDEESNIVSEKIMPTADTEIKKYAKKRCPFNHMTVMFKKSSINEAGGYLPFFYNEDYYLWVRMQLKNMTFANIDEILVSVRTGKDQFNRRGGKKYYKSEVTLQKYMYKNKMIGWFTFKLNCFKRFVFQRMIPSRLRGYLYKKLLRKKRKK